MLKIKFHVDEKDWHSHSSETVWAEEADVPDEFILKNAPFFAKGVSFGDRVVAVKNGLDLVFDRIVKYGGYSTYRLIPVKVGDAIHRIDDLIDFLKNEGCLFEGGVVGNMPVVVVSVPPESSADVCYLEIVRKQNLGEVHLEVAHDGHPS